MSGWADVVLVVEEHSSLGYDLNHEIMILCHTITQICVCSIKVILDYSYYLTSFLHQRHCGFIYIYSTVNHGEV